MKQQLKVDTDVMAEAMAAKGYDVKGLADVMGRTKEGIQYILDEQRTKLRTLAEIADVLGLKPKDLLRD